VWGPSKEKINTDQRREFVLPLVELSRKPRIKEIKPTLPSKKKGEEREGNKKPGEVMHREQYDQKGVEGKTNRYHSFY